MPEPYFYSDPLSNAVDALGVGAVVLSRTVVLGAAAVSFPDGVAGAVLHLVERGALRVSVGSGTALSLAEGDLVVLPRARNHVVGTAGAGRPTQIDQVPTRRTVSGAKLLTVGTGPDVQAEVFSAYFTYRVPGGTPLVGLLPKRLVVRAARRGADLDAVLGLLSGEMAHPRPGGRAVAGLLVGAALVAALRADTLDGDRVAGLLDGLREPRLARALGAVSEAPGAPWTLDRLAVEAGLSRSRLATLFRERVGVPPLEYVARWRVALAQTLLLEGALSMTDVAERVGYGSDVAFSRAFRRVVGVPPGRWRDRL